MEKRHQTTDKRKSTNLNDKNKTKQNNPRPRHIIINYWKKKDKEENLKGQRKKDVLSLKKQQLNW